MPAQRDDRSAEKHPKLRAKLGFVALFVRALQGAENNLSGTLDLPASQKDPGASAPGSF